MKNPESQRVKELRKSLNETLKDFGDRFGVSHTNIQNIESDNQPLSIKLAKQIAQEFSVSLDWLYGNDSANAGNTGNINVSKNEIKSSNVDNTHKEFYEKIIEEKDQRIQMYEAFLKNREEDLSHCREQVAYFKNLYDQVGNKK